MRCLALADGLKRRGARVHFVSRHAPQSIRELAMAGGHDVTLLDSKAETDPVDTLDHSLWLGTSRRADARDTARALGGESWDWLIVDHYALDAYWETAVRACAQRVLAIDDIADRVHNCDLLLDQNFNRDGETRYADKVPSTCRLLLGPRYALLRDEFSRARAGTLPRSGEIHRVMIFFGGVDAAGHTSESIEAIASLDQKGLQVDVVVGVQHAQREAIEARCAALGFTCHVQTRRMAELMATADLALGAGGSATWERCCLGLPAIVRAVADNQRHLVEEAALAGLHLAPDFDAGASLADQLRGLLSNTLLLRALSRNGMDTVDGRGVERVQRAMGFGVVDVRRASMADSPNVFAWRNDPSIRAMSRNADPIDRSAHDAWFAAALADADRLILIGTYNGEDIGVVRFDLTGCVAEISIYLAPKAGDGVSGAELLLAAESWLAENRPQVSAVEAEVLRDNHSSHGLFGAGGYRLESSRYVKRFV